jgi:hypothetical protein
VENSNKDRRRNKTEETFGLPDNYFDLSKNSIRNSLEWQEEHKEYVNLLNHKSNFSSPNGGFTFPVNYFEKNEGKFELLNTSILFSLKQETGFSIPENYFEHQSFTTILRKSSTIESENSEYQAIQLIAKQNNFEVPQDYFSKSALKTKIALKVKKPVQIININRRTLTFAAAAAVILSFGIYLYQFYFTPAQLKDCGTMACIDKSDLMKTKNLENIETEELYELVNPGELEKKLRLSDEKETINKIDSNLNSLSTEALLDEI